MSCTVRNKCTSLDGAWMRLTSGSCGFGHGDIETNKLDYMLWHKHISFENGETCDKSRYRWEKMLEYGRAWTRVIHMRLIRKVDRMTVDGQRHTVRQQYRGLWQWMCWSYENVLSSSRRKELLWENCADHKQIEKNTGFWRLRLLVIMSLGRFSEKGFPIHSLFFGTHSLRTNGSVDIILLWDVKKCFQLIEKR